MDDDAPQDRPDMTLGYLSKQDLYGLSVDELEERIDALRAEIARCEAALGDRGSTRAAAEKLFKI